MTVLLAAGPLAAKRLLPRFGLRFLTLAGGILTTAGVAWMSVLPDQAGGQAGVLVINVGRGDQGQRHGRDHIGSVAVAA